MTQIDILDEIVVPNEATPADMTVQEFSWGYVIRSQMGPTTGTQVAQGISHFLGIFLAIAALGTLALPFFVFGSQITAFGLGGSALFAAMAAYLLWFASRGDTPTVNVDLDNREIREVIENRMGGPTLLGVYPFEEIEDVFAATEEGAEMAQLVLWLRGTDEVICIAQALPGQLVELRDRIASDLGR